MPRAYLTWYQGMQALCEAVCYKTERIVFIYGYSDNAHAKSQLFDEGETSSLKPYLVLHVLNVNWQTIWNWTIWTACVITKKK